MSLIECHKCGHDVSTQAIQCPNCGANVKKLKETQETIPTEPITFPFTCPHCGYKNIQPRKLCKKCNQELKAQPSEGTQLDNFPIQEGNQSFTVAAESQGSLDKGTLSMLQPIPKRLEKALSEILDPNERVYLKLKGAFGEALVCTESRVIILKAGFMTGNTFGTNTFQLPYSHIAGVQVDYHLLSGYFELSAGGMQNLPKNYWSTSDKADPKKAPNCIALNTKEQAKQFREACKFILSKIDKKRSISTISSRNQDSPTAKKQSRDEIFNALTQLKQLKDKGIISEDEFENKKKSLLERL